MGIKTENGCPEAASALVAWLQKQGRKNETFGPFSRPKMWIPKMLRRIIMTMRYGALWAHGLSLIFNHDHAGTPITVARLSRITKVAPQYTLIFYCLSFSAAPANFREQRSRGKSQVRSNKKKGLSSHCQRVTIHEDL